MKREQEKEKKMWAYRGFNNKVMKGKDDSRLTDCLNEIKVFQKTE